MDQGSPHQQKMILFGPQKPVSENKIWIGLKFTPETPWVKGIPVNKRRINQVIGIKKRVKKDQKQFSGQALFRLA